MNIYFEGKTNYREIMVNNAIFILKDGSKVTVDRDETGFSFYGNGQYEMQWSGIYIWDGEKGDYVDDESIFDGAFLDKIEYEDDAPADCRISITKWSV